MHIRHVRSVPERRSQRCFRLVQSTLTAQYRTEISVGCMEQKISNTILTTINDTEFYVDRRQKGEGKQKKMVETPERFLTTSPPLNAFRTRVYTKKEKENAKP